MVYVRDDRNVAKVHLHFPRGLNPCPCKGERGTPLQGARDRRAGSTFRARLPAPPADATAQMPRVSRGQANRHSPLGLACGGRKAPAKTSHHRADPLSPAAGASPKSELNRITPGHHPRAKVPAPRAPWAARARMYLTHPAGVPVWVGHRPPQVARHVREADPSRAMGLSLRWTDLTSQGGGHGSRIDVAAANMTRPDRRGG